MDVLRFIEAVCEFICRNEGSYKGNKDYQECFRECLEQRIRMVRENMKHSGSMNLGIDYEDEEEFEEEEFEDEEDWDDWRMDGLMDVYSGLGPATAFYARVDKALRTYGITSVYPVRGFYDEVIKELTTSGDSSIEAAVRRVLRKHGLLST